MIDIKYIKDALSDELKDCEVLEYLDTKLYLVNKDKMKKILVLSISTKGLETKKEHTDSFFPFGKIINPNEPAVKYSLIKQERYRTVTGRESVLKDIESRFIVAVNTKKKKFEEYMAKNTNINKELLDKRKKELDVMIDEGTKNLNKILANYDKYDVVITDYVDRKIYPFCYYHTHKNENGKIIKKHFQKLLRKDVPNILWYEPIESIRDKRENKNIDTIINTYDNILDKIYFKEREK